MSFRSEKALLDLLDLLCFIDWMDVGLSSSNFGIRTEKFYLFLFVGLLLPDERHLPGRCSYLHVVSHFCQRLPLSFGWVEVFRQ